MNRYQFMQEAIPMMEIVDEAFSKLFEPRSNIIVEHRGVSFGISGHHTEAEEGRPADFEATKIWLASDDGQTDLIDCIKDDVLLSLEGLALERMEG